MQQPSSGIYEIRNKINDKRYIGSACCFRRRFIEHKKQLRNNRHHSNKLQNAWNKYGESSFEFIILKHCSIRCLVKQEQKYIDKFNSFCGGYNCNPVAGSCLGRKLSEEHKQKISKANYGRKVSEGTRKKMSVARLGKKPSVKTKYLMSLAQKGKIFSLEHRHKISVATSKRMIGNKYTLGFKHTKKTISKMRKTHLGKPLSLYHLKQLRSALRKKSVRLKMSKAHFGKRHTSKHCRAISKGLQKRYRG